MAETLQHNDWKGTTGGMPWMQRSLVHILGRIDQHVIYALLVIIVPFYMLFGHRGYLAQYHYFRQRHGLSPWRSFCMVYANHYRFGQIIIDRFAVYGGRQFRLEMEGYERWHELSQRPEGFMMVSSHTGNFELCGYMLRSENKNLSALVYMGETETVMQNRQRVFTSNNIKMVPVMSDMSHIFVLNNALADGEIVSMPGDRIFGSQKYITCTLLGAEAKLPAGAYTMAVARDCALMAVFVMKKDWQTYQVIIRDVSAVLDSLPADVASQKAARRQALAQRFADEMTAVLRRYPTQWFNYYEFWEQ